MDIDTSGIRRVCLTTRRKSGGIHFPAGAIFIGEAISLPDGNTAVTLDFVPDEDEKRAAGPEPADVHTLARKIAYAIFGPASASYETIQNTIVRILDEKRAAEKEPDPAEKATICTKEPIPVDFYFKGHRIFIETDLGDYSRLARQFKAYLVSTLPDLGDDSLEQATLRAEGNAARAPEVLMSQVFATAQGLKDKLEASISAQRAAGKGSEPITDNPRVYSSAHDGPDPLHTIRQAIDAQNAKRGFTATSTPAQRATDRIIAQYAGHRTGFLGGLNEAIFNIIDEELRKG